MNTQRAQEIINAPVMINVEYHGIPVYIQDVNEDDETVTIFPLDEMDNTQEVDLTGLVEVGP
ncbi:H-type small acid-soluble spore protein [Texcoconibacillus texcoconensis]|uniref:Small, acid-soluble spore protein H n=1 Tax=Texcoconibacillus texcoconensis TaxID=1095777 RepID=A0A840QTT3_9BACI|nr:H-type small acid-soluble spore protein [Texcoconibacillus texcoconensis]MBB5174723.1 small acid-soluble spore protein H (minor) [Texcoconibacillus texcoconensis]